MTTDAQVRKFLRRLKAPAPEVMRAVFTRGGCYALVEILECVFPDVEAWQSCRKNGVFDGDHVIARVDGKFYDIVGQVKLRPCYTAPTYETWTNRRGVMRYRRMSPTERMKARKWKCSWSYLVNGEPSVRVDK